MKLAFVTPPYPLSGIPIGAASHGMVGCEDETLPNVCWFSPDLHGEIVIGSYEECLSHLPDKVPQAVVVLLGNAGGENEFVAELSKLLPCPMTGGGAAIDGVSGKKGLITGGGEAALFFIQDDRYELSVESKSVHTQVLEECELELEKPRLIRTINGTDALCWYQQKRAQLGLQEMDFEHLTLADRYGVNAHLSITDGKLAAGRDLQTHMVLRYAPPADVQKQMQEFYDEPDCVVFGCAGLKDLLEQPLKTEGLGLFLFGEVCTMNGKVEFGNLMLSKLSVRQKG